MPAPYDSNALSLSDILAQSNAAGPPPAPAGGGAVGSMTDPQLSHFAMSDAPGLQRGVGIAQGNAGFSPAPQSLGAAIALPSPQGPQPIAPGSVVTVPQGGAGANGSPMAMNLPLPGVGGGKGTPAQTIDLVSPGMQGREAEGYGAVQQAMRGEGAAAQATGGALANQATLEATGIGQGQNEKIKNAEGLKQDAYAQARALNPMLVAENQASNEAAGFKVNTNRYLENMSGFQKGLYGLAALFSGFGEGFKGRESPVLRELSEMQDKDIAAQRQEFEAKKGRVSDLNNIFAKAYQITGNTADAQKLARVWSNDAWAQQAKKLATAAGTPVALKKGDEVAAHFETEANKAGLAGVEKLASQQRYVPAQPGGAGGLDMKAVHALAEKFQFEKGLDPDSAFRRAVYTLYQHDVMPGAGAMPGVVGTGALPKGAGVDVGTQAASLHPKSTEWNMLGRNIQGTEGFRNVQEQGAYNSLVLTQAHKNGIRDPEKAAEVMRPFMAQPGDSQATIDMKRASFLKVYGGAAGAASSADETPPPGFEPIGEGP